MSMITINERRTAMKKVDPLQKCVIINAVHRLINNTELMAGDKMTIVIETKRNGELKSLTVKEGE